MASSSLLVARREHSGAHLWQRPVCLRASAQGCDGPFSGSGGTPYHTAHRLVKKSYAGALLLYVRLLQLPDLDRTCFYPYLSGDLNTASVFSCVRCVLGGFCTCARWVWERLAELPGQSPRSLNRLQALKAWPPLASSPEGEGRDSDNDEAYHSLRFLASQALLTENGGDGTTGDRSNITKGSASSIASAAHAAALRIVYPPEGADRMA